MVFDWSSDCGGWNREQQVAQSACGFGENEKRYRAFESLSLHRHILGGCRRGFSTWYVVGRGNLRFAVNVLWQWIGLGILLFVLIWAEQHVRLKAAVLPWMLVFAMATSFHGLYQYSYSLPRDRQLFRNNPDEAARRAGVDAPEGSAVRMRMSDRIESREPFGPFALANSLAGFLAPSLILFAAGIFELTGIRRRRFDIAVHLAMIAAIAIVLILTKSRSAWLAVMGGIAFYGVMHPGLRRACFVRLKWLAPTILLAVGIAAFAIFTVDARILTEAPKSFFYRSQYWYAALRMIVEHPWVGVGPGNFQDNYSAFKLPTASETVYDPHNFLLEVGATSGIVSMVIIALGMIGLGWLVWKSRSTSLSISQDSARVSAGEQAMDWNRRRLIVLSVAIGVLVSLVVVTAVPQMFGGGPEILPYWLAGIGCAMWLYAYRPWRFFHELSDLAVVSSVLVSVINLCAAGGWLAFGVMQVMIVCSAIIIGGRWKSGNQLVSSEPIRHPRSTKDASSKSEMRLEPLGLLSVCLSMILAWACSKTMVLPVLESKQAIESSVDTLEQFEQNVERASQIDPWESHYAMLQVQLAFQHLERAGPGSTEQIAAKERVFAATERLIRIRPRFSKTFEMIGQLALPYREIDPELAILAEQSVVRAAELAPHEANVRLQAATVLWLGNQQSTAKANLEMAMQLDRLTPHRDLKLRAHAIWLSPTICTRLNLENELQLDNPEQLIQLRSGWVPAEPWASFLRSRL